MERPIVIEWSGDSARVLQEAVRMTNEEFAEALGVAVRTVAGWRTNPGVVPRREFQRALDTFLERAADTARRRFTALMEPREQSGMSVVLAAENALLQARLDELERKLADFGIRL